MAALQSGVTPFVRVPTLSPELVARVLDGGALGVIAPHVKNCKRDARRAVECAKYPPLGHRSSGVSLPHFEYRNVPATLANPALNAATTVIALIESREGIANAEEIAAVDGIDIVSIGTNDLCADLGIAGQIDHQLVDEAYMSLIHACKKHKKHSGISGLASRRDLMTRYVKAGARFISLTNDLSLLMNAAADRAREAQSMTACLVTVIDWRRLQTGQMGITGSISMKKLLSLAFVAAASRLQTYRPRPTTIPVSLSAFSSAILRVAAPM